MNLIWNETRTDPFMFASLMQRLQSDGVNVTKIRGYWMRNRDSVNYSQYIDNLSSMDASTAAANTWTGRMAARYGYTKIEIPGSRISNMGTIKVLFGR
jgi:filamentous hemagglutinin